MNYSEMYLNWHPTSAKKSDIVLLDVTQYYHNLGILYHILLSWIRSMLANPACLWKVIVKRLLSSLCPATVWPRCNPYCEYHWSFTNVLLSCPWAGGLFRLLMASCSFTWKLFMGLVFSVQSACILTAWGLGGERWRRSWSRCCFWSSPPPPPPPSSPSRPWSWRTRWWWRRGWEGTGGASLSPGSIRTDCQHPHRGTWKTQLTLRMIVPLLFSFLLNYPYTCPQQIQHSSSYFHLGFNSVPFLKSLI